MILTLSQRMDIILREESREKIVAYQYQATRLF